MDTKQEAWEKKQVSLTENIRKLEIALGEALARIRELETQSAADHAIAEQLRSQASTMNAKLSEYSKISEALYNISRMPH
ncbi:hypothetical protein LPJ61_005582 [Coemansia biformis]|uniref:Uncharacterized protein n=1 Tax=Coemansia biformis TaxID=1286918 RepID=A0A9W7Y743_9FUNG|nr:hypothetical protein LPJ61_005582 [Coemansia biformis]